MRAELFERWRDVCVKQGLAAPSEEHGVDVRPSKYAGAYLAKWGSASELTAATKKQAKEGRYNPFALLREYGERKVADWKDQGARFVEFAEAFKGRNQLVWSEGLKARFGIEEKSDEELAEASDDAVVEGTRVRVSAVDGIGRPSDLRVLAWMNGHVELFRLVEFDVSLGARGEALQERVDAWFVELRQEVRRRHPGRIEGWRPRPREGRPPRVRRRARGDPPRGPPLVGGVMTEVGEAYAAALETRHAGGARRARKRKGKT
jgi:hypothetical protein